MNCQIFHNQLQEHLEGSLSVEEQFATQAHLAQCGECNALLARQKVIASSLRQALHRGVQNYALDKQSRQRILGALRQKQTGRAKFSGKIAAWFALPLWQTGMVAVAIVLAGLVTLGIRFHIRHASSPVAETYVLDIPMESETHVFDIQRGGVIDATLQSHGTMNLSSPDKF